LTKAKESDCRMKEKKMSNAAKSILKARAAGAILRRARYADHFVLLFPYGGVVVPVHAATVKELVDAGRVLPEVFSR